MIFQDNKDELAWSNFFVDFGTHFISELHLGGKMIHTVTMTSEAIQKLANDGLDVSAEVAGAYGPVSASASASVGKKAASENGFGTSAPPRHVAAPSA